ncbi:DUF1003 domain-containing protein [Siphonobacter sp. SORGH_AS_0500]|uniref:DUF1003 domain-containing protein n=1 Tax=Siphonobacter sp. SORGH_AS_0500 TaxID=1864824 RepID=UPI002856490C|nr:DUF1003 domain-containing protein [Siphonobacter sp. SORGH_AS_0500]MDR6195471.1 putative membrane protein [Siphonobacter sp. SORGH_AS_0500]
MMNDSHKFRKLAHLKKVETELESSDQTLQQVHSWVRETIVDETLITQKISETEADEQPSFGNRMADGVAEFGGSWKFILSFMAFLIIWIAINSLYFILQKPFDPYPFILLNLILSCVAAIQAPIIMMSQNRQEAKDRQRARNDYATNLKAEIEIQRLHDKMNFLLDEIADLKAKLGQ